MRLRAGGHARAAGLRIFEATGADIADLGEEHGDRVLRVCGKGTKIVLVPLPPVVGRAIDRAIGLRTRGPILLNTRGSRMDRHAATRRLRHLAENVGIQVTGASPAPAITNRGNSFQHASSGWGIQHGWNIALYRFRRWR